MKIYVHYEAQEPEFTLAVNLAPSDGRTAKELKHEFIEAYAKRHGISLDPEGFNLATDKKKLLIFTDVILTTCKANADIFLVPKAGGKTQPKPVKTAPQPRAAAAAPPPPAKIAPASASSCTPSASASASASSSSSHPHAHASAATQKAAAPAASAAQKASAPTGHQPAREQEQQAASTRPSILACDEPSRSSHASTHAPPPSTSPSSSAPSSSAAVSKAQAAWRRPKVQPMEAPPQVTKWVSESLALARSLVAKKSMRQACEAWKQILNVSAGSVECLDGMASVAMSCGRYDEAVDLWCQAVAVSSKPSPDLYSSIGKACHAQADYVGALVFYNRAVEAKIEANKDDTCEDIKVLMAKSLAASGQKDASVQLLTLVLQANESHVGALLEYARAYKERGRPNEALQILLRVLVHSPNDKDARGLISSIAKAPGGLDVMSAELGDAAKSGPALAFMATLVKDYGAVDESVALYYKALEAAPDMTTYVLNLVHTLEVCNRYQEAMDLSIKFCKEYGDMTVGGLYKNADVARVMEGCSDIYSSSLRSGDHPGLNKVVYWVPNLGSVVRHRSDKSDMPDPSQSTALPSPAAKAPAKADQRIPPYSPDELDLLALHFTMVKIMFVTGALALIPQLVEVIEIGRRGWDMHLTTIRNEHAYYCCVTQLYCEVPSPFPSTPETIYSAGDSHSLSSAWQVIKVHGRDTQMVPALVTGLKCFHLRPEAVFFPKNNFYNVINKIPRGSRVLFMFGEIDCREGIIMAVEKGKYTDVEEGISKTIDYYLNVLESLASSLDFTIYVQPVAPVLNETRDVVKVFNEALKAKVNKIKCLTFIDILDGLLTPDKKALRQEYEMDGTHMGPAYVKLIQEKLNQLSPPP